MTCQEGYFFLYGAHSNQITDFKKRIPEWETKKISPFTLYMELIRFHKVNWLIESEVTPDKKMLPIVNVI